jgi:hypothetical protein
MEFAVNVVLIGSLSVPRRGLRVVARDLHFVVRDCRSLRVALAKSNLSRCVAGVGLGQQAGVNRWRLARSLRDR